MGEEIVVTYQTLFEALQREKERTDLQKLDITFYNDTINYISDKKKILEKGDDSVFASGEKRKTERQLENVYKIIKELYERREKKILMMAFDKSKTKTNLIDTSSLLEEEKALFSVVTNTLDGYREGILGNILNCKLPAIPNKKPQLEIVKPVPEQEKVEEQKEEIPQPLKFVRFLGEVPKFVGPELEEYGPFGKEDMANLPGIIAEILITKGKAEEMKGE